MTITLTPLQAVAMISDDVMFDMCCFILQVCELDKEHDGEELEDAVKDLSGYDTMPVLFIGGHAVGTCDGEYEMTRHEMTVRGC